MPVCCRGLRLGRGLGVADAAFRRGDFAIVVHRIGLFFALLFDHLGLVFHGVLLRAWRHCVGLIVDGVGLGLRLILDLLGLRALAIWAEGTVGKGGVRTCKF